MKKLAKKIGILLGAAGCVLPIAGCTNANLVEYTDSYYLDDSINKLKNYVENFTQVDAEECKIVSNIAEFAYQTADNLLNSTVDKIDQNEYLNIVNTIAYYNGKYVNKVLKFALNNLCKNDALLVQNYQYNANVVNQFLDYNKLNAEALKALTFGYSSKTNQMFAIDTFAKVVKYSDSKLQFDSDSNNLSYSNNYNAINDFKSKINNQIDNCTNNNATINFNNQTFVYNIKVNTQENNYGFMFQINQSNLLYRFNYFSINKNDNLSESFEFATVSQDEFNLLAVPAKHFVYDLANTKSQSESL